MEKIYSALGFMSGTSADGVDSSIIKSDGKDQILIENNEYNPFPQFLTDEIHNIKEKFERMNDSKIIVICLDPLYENQNPKSYAEKNTFRLWCSCLTHCP